MNVKIISLLLVLSLIFGCDPGWKYILVRPELKSFAGEYSDKYKTIKNNLDIKIRAHDFVFRTYVDLKLSILNQSEIEIYPIISQIRSHHFKDVVHIPNDIEIKHSNRENIVNHKKYTIETPAIYRKDNRFINSLENWDNNKCTIESYDYISKEEHINIPKNKLLSSYRLTKYDTLFITTKYPGFAIYDSSFYHWSGKQISDFQYSVDIFKDNKPLVFEFRPGND